MNTLPLLLLENNLFELRFKVFPLYIKIQRVFIAQYFEDYHFDHKITIFKPNIYIGTYLRNIELLTFYFSSPVFELMKSAWFHFHFHELEKV